MTAPLCRPTALSATLLRFRDSANRDGGYVLLVDGATNAVVSYTWGLDGHLASNASSHAYDPIGNRTTSTDGFGQRSYTHNALNAMLSDSRVSLAYDADGNLVSDGARTFAWDAENRLIYVTTNTVRYLWGLDQSETLQGAGGVGGLVAAIRDGAAYFPCYDANGNITEYVSESGAYGFALSGNCVANEMLSMSA